MLWQFNFITTLRSQVHDYVKTFYDSRFLLTVNMWSDSCRRASKQNPSRTQPWALLTILRSGPPCSCHKCRQTICFFMRHDSTLGCEGPFWVAIGKKWTLHHESLFSSVHLCARMRPTFGELTTKPTNVCEQYGVWMPAGAASHVSKSFEPKCLVLYAGSPLQIHCRKWFAKLSQCEHHR